MIYVGIDVVKNKHDCFIMNSEGEVLADVFTIANSKDGFDKLLKTIKTCTDICDSKIKVELEATGHYSYNLPPSFLIMSCQLTLSTHCTQIFIERV